MDAPYKVTVYGERAEEFRDVFGGATVPVKSPLPGLATVAGEEKMVYMLDIERLGAEQYDRLVQHLARKFGEAEVAVAAELTQYGLPILADDVTVTVQQPMIFDDDLPEPFGLFDDIDD